MEDEVITILIIVQSAIGLTISTVLLIDYILNIKIDMIQQNYKLEISLLITNSLQEMCMSIQSNIQGNIIYFTDQNYANFWCNFLSYAVQALSISSLIWVILILQKCFLLTRYNTPLAIEYLSSNQYLLQFIIAIVLPLFTTSIIFVPSLQKSSCSSLDILQSNSEIYWAIQTTLIAVLLFIIIFNTLKIHFIKKQAKLLHYLFFSFFLLFVYLPWLLYSGGIWFQEHQKLKANRTLLIQIFWFLKDTSIIYTSLLLGFNQKCQQLFIEITCDLFRTQYLQKYKDENISPKKPQMQIIEITNTSNELILNQN